MFFLSTVVKRRMQVSPPAKLKTLRHSGTQVARKTLNLQIRKLHRRTLRLLRFKKERGRKKKNCTYGDPDNKQSFKISFMLETLKKKLHNHQICRAVDVGSSMDRGRPDASNSTIKNSTRHQMIAVSQLSC